MLSTRFISLLVLPLAASFVLEFPQLTSRRKTFSRASSSPSPLFLAAGIIKPENEFSRTVQPERVIRSRRDFTIDIEASPEECSALAGRFDLKDIDKLNAHLAMRSERRGNGVEVEGTVFATVTQTCVRTNEDFAVDLEFPLYCIVRPVAPLSVLLEQQQQQQKASSSANSSKDKKKRDKKDIRPSNSIDDMDISELERLLQQDAVDEDDILMEDEAIYATDGLLDVGELVSQLFWLQLDPYPKRPGTNPIQKSITG